MKANEDHLNLVEFAVEQAKKNGADGAEAFLAEVKSAEIMISDRKPEQVNAVQDVGVGLRILKDQKMVSGSSNDLSRASVEELISDLLGKVSYHTADEHNVIPAETDDSLSEDWSSFTDRVSFDPELADVPITEKIKQAIRIEEAGLDYSPQVKGSMIVLYQDNSQLTYLANSNGISGWYPSSGLGGYAEFIAGDGEEQQSGDAFIQKVSYSSFDPTELGRKAAGKGVRMLGARPIASCEVSLIVDPEVGQNFVGLVARLACADQVQTGKSLLAGKLGEEIAARSINIIDDGILPGGLATSPVDGEGVPRQTTPIIVNGVLKNYLYDSYCATRGKTKSTGNRSRGNYQSSGGVGLSNVYLEAGSDKPEALLTEIDKGFYVNLAFGLHAGVDSTSGDFSFPVAGFLIEKGEITTPVRGISMAGNMFEFLKSIDKIADDLAWFGAVGCPTFSVKNIAIGGV